MFPLCMTLYGHRLMQGFQKAIFEVASVMLPPTFRWTLLLNFERSRVQCISVVVVNALFSYLL